MGTLSFTSKSSKRTTWGSLSYLTILTLTAFALMALTVGIGSSKSWAATWPMHDGDASMTRSDQGSASITPEDVADLGFKDGWGTDGKVNLAGIFPGMLPIKTPVVDDEVVCMTFIHLDGNGAVACLDRNDGSLKWAKTINEIALETIPYIDNPKLFDPLILGSETSPLLYGDYVYISTKHDGRWFDEFGALHVLQPKLGGGYVIRCHKLTGNCADNPDGPNSGKAWVRLSENPFEGVLGSPTMHEGSAYFGISGYEEGAASYPEYEGQCCTTQGKVCKVDLNNMSKKWCWHTHDANPATIEYDAQYDGLDMEGFSGTTVWSSCAVHPPENKLYCATGNAYTFPAYVADLEDPEGFLASIDPKSLPVDAIVALDLDTGLIQDVFRVIDDENGVPDFWNADCVLGGLGGNCEFEPIGPDYDFGAGPTLVPLNDGSGRVFAIAINKAARVVGRDTADLSQGWVSDPLGPTNLGGLAGTSYDGTYVYASNPNTFDIQGFDENGFPLAVSRLSVLQAGPLAGEPTWGGVLSALDPVTGDVAWQNTSEYNFGPELLTFDAIIPFEPFLGNEAFLGPSSASNGGVVFQGSLYFNWYNFTVLEAFFGLPFQDFLGLALLGYIPDPETGDPIAPFYPQVNGGYPSLHAFDSNSGDLLRSISIPGPMVDTPAIVDGVLYGAAAEIGFDQNFNLILTPTVFAMEVDPGAQPSDP